MQLWGRKESGNEHHGFLTSCPKPGCSHGHGSTCYVLPRPFYSQPWASGMIGQGLKTQAQVHGGHDSVSCSPSMSGKGHSLWLFPHGNCQLPCWGESQGYFREG